MQKQPLMQLKFYICSMKLKKPTLLLDKQKCLNNISKMKAKADKHGLTFRPHFKTHQSAQVGEWFKVMGIHKIAVSSVSMAQYFADHNWRDITIAFPLNIAEIEDIDKLASKIKINVLIENTEAIGFLDQHIHNELGLFIKLDAGYHRTGVFIEDGDKILSLIREIKTKSRLHFMGFIIHNGHSYHASGPDDVLQIHNQSLAKISLLKRSLLQEGSTAIFSIGDTPAMSLTENFDQIDEIRPGNFVFYDLMQAQLGACKFDDIAVALACPVVAKHDSRKEIVIYGGAIHLSKEYILDKQSNKIFGRIAELTADGWNDPCDASYIKSVSQEHGIIKATPDFYTKIKVGDFIVALPVHSCLTVDAMREMYTFDHQKIKTLNS